MSITLNTIETLIKRQMSSVRPLITVQTKFVQGLIALGVFFFFLSIGFILYGIYTGLSLQYSIEITSIYMGLILGGMAGMTGVIGYIYTSYRRQYMRRLHRKMPQKVHDVLLSLDDELGDVIRGYPKTSVLLASIAGFVAENRL